MSESVLLSDAAPFFEDMGPGNADPLTEGERASFDEIVASIQAGAEAPEPRLDRGLEVPFAMGLLAHASVPDIKHRDPDRTWVPSTDPYTTEYTSNPTGGSPSVDEQAYNDLD